MANAKRKSFGELTRELAGAYVTEAVKFGKEVGDHVKKEVMNDLNIPHGNNCRCTCGSKRRR